MVKGERRKVLENSRKAKGRKQKAKRKRERRMVIDTRIKKSTKPKGQAKHHY